MKHFLYCMIVLGLFAGCNKSSKSSNPAGPTVFVVDDEGKATIISNNTKIFTDEAVRLEVIHSGNLPEKIIWYFDDGSGEIELQSDISPVFNIDNFSLLNEGIYRVELYVNGSLFAEDTIELSLEVTTTTPPSGGSGSTGTFFTLSAQSVGTVKNVYKTGDDVFLKANHDHVDFDTYRWFLDTGGGKVEIAGHTVNTLALSPSVPADSGDYTVEILKAGVVVEEDTFSIQIVSPTTTGFVDCAGDPASCPAPILIPNDGASHNCPIGQVATSCNGKQEQGCLFDPATDGFRCTDGGDGNGCFLYCHDLAASAAEKSVLLSDGFLDFFNIVNFKEEDGEASCAAGEIATGCSGYEDQSCVATVQGRFECDDKGSGDDKGCQLFCWQVHDETNRMKTISFDGDEKASCEAGYVPTGCSGDDEDFCKPTANAGEYKCVDQFWGSGCTLHCLKVD